MFTLCILGKVKLNNLATVCSKFLGNRIGVLFPLEFEKQEK